MRNGFQLVTLEEHFASPAFPSAEGGDFVPEFADQVGARISDVEEHRLPEMDSYGIDVQVLSLTTPGVQGLPGPEEAIEKASSSNDFFGEVIKKYPDRFSGFAALPMQDPAAAARELHRAVEELGLKGALVNGHTNGVYLDDARFEPLWPVFERLDVPLYIHPTFSPETFAALRDWPDLNASAWGWQLETSTHALRLIVSGLFDRHPKLKVILGHMGEGLPFALHRIDDRWDIQRHRVALAKRPSEYFRENFWITTSGVETPVPLRAALDELGADRIMFSADYPYQKMQSAADFIATVDLPAEVRGKITSENAVSLLRL